MSSTDKITRSEDLRTANGNSLHPSVSIPRPDLVNIYGATVGEGCSIGPFVEIQRHVVIGKRVKVQSHAFICEGVHIEDDCFIGHGVCFTNDRYPASVTPDGSMMTDGDWTLEETRVRRGAAIGSGVTLLPGITIGERTIIGAGAVVTKSCDDHGVYAGVPAKKIRSRERP